MRCLSLLSALRELGWSTTLLSSALAQNAWTAEGIAGLRAGYVSDVRIYRLGPADRCVRRVSAHWSSVRARVDGRPQLDSWSVVPPGLRIWSRRQAESIEPELMLSSYAQYDPVVPHSRLPDARTVIDSIDVVSVSHAMWGRLGPQLHRQSPLLTSDVAEEVLSETYLDDLWPVASRELRLYDRYSETLAISTAEANVIRGGTFATRVHFVPMTAVTAGTNCYEGRAVFVGGANPFNLQGLLWFARHVLPATRRTAPDFELDAVGDTFVSWRPDDGIVAWGVIDDLGGLYERAAFAISPVLAGTGQQVKVIDAMAHGLAVVAHENSAAASPIIDGVNGYVVQSAQEFAERATMLWRDRSLCRRLGGAARETIAADYPPSRTVSELEKIWAASTSVRGSLLPGGAAPVKRHSRSTGAKRT